MDKEIIWVLRGSQRKSLFYKIPEKPFLSNKFRKELNRDTGTNLSLREISRHLKDFEKIKAIKCLNPKDPYNRFYEITLKGKKLKKNISKLEI